MRIFAPSKPPHERIIHVSGLPEVFEIGHLDFSSDSEDDAWSSFARCEGASEKTFEDAVAPGHDFVCSNDCHCSWWNFIDTEEGDQDDFLDMWVQPAFARGVLVTVCCALFNSAAPMNDSFAIMLPLLRLLPLPVTSLSSCCSTRLESCAGACCCTYICKRFPAMHACPHAFK